MNFFTKMFKAATFDVATYEEVEADSKATAQALLVVVLSSLAAGISTIKFTSATTVITSLLTGTFIALAGWFVWAYVTYLIGTKMFPEPQTSSDHGELLRTTGFASAPGLLKVFGLIPVVGPFVFLLVSFWMLATMIVGVRQALDYTNTWRAIGVCLVGWIFYTLFFYLLTALLNSL